MVAIKHKKNPSAVARCFEQTERGRVEGYVNGIGTQIATLMQTRLSLLI